MPVTPLPVIENVWRCTFHWSALGGADNAVSVQHFRFDGDASDLVGFIDGDVQTHQFEGLHEDTFAATVDMLKLDGTSATVTEPLENWAGESGSGGDSLVGIAIMIEGQTGLRGPANRGRLFLPSPIESVIDHGALASANATEISNAWQAYLDVLDGHGVEYGVASYVHENFHQFVNMRVPTKLGRIRRRQPG